MTNTAEAERRDRLAEIVRTTPALIRVLETMRGLDLPDWLIFSGAVYQPVLNRLTGRPAEHGLNDYDIGYFDASDLSYEAEDRVIRRVAAAFPEPLSRPVQVRNQARVHLWFEARFCEAYTALSSTAEALERSSRRLSRSASGSARMGGCTSRRRSASTTSSRCASGPTPTARPAASPAPPPASPRAGPS